ncbi:amidohydrolase [Corynebacterium pacaense]|uniref:amidohydrolase n=1 Tax=Corynebacterium pacaense TaxID=1816684 RepID=UPI0009BAB15A|nr:amidohydrolase [Corynebacterium pacaense]
MTTSVSPTDPLNIYFAFDAAQEAAPGAVSGAPDDDHGDGVSHFAGAPEQIQRRIADHVESLRPELEALARDLHDHPETAFREHRSARAIADLLRSHGVDAEVGAFGLDTAVHAGDTAGKGTEQDAPPHFAIVAEYDALPEVGHACGHNIIAGVAVGAYLALREVIVDIGGRISFIGAPAEESGGGKELILRAGGFDDVDAAGMVHPGVGDGASPVYGPGTSGVRRIAVTYRGRAAHAAMSPYLGLNALDAVVTAYQSVAQLRQHILPVDRIHGVITNGGSAANVVPETASAVFLIRSTEIETLDVLTERVAEILRAAALSTGTTAEIDLDFEPAYLPLKNNVELIKRWSDHLRDRGRTVPLRSARLRQGGPSTDMGNVSQFIPAIHPSLGLGGAPDVSPHNAAFADTTVQPAATDALVDAAVSLSGTAADYLADAGLRAAVRREFDYRIHGRVN